MPDAATTVVLHAYIDSNILLNFYAYPKSDLDQVTKLVESIRAGNLVLYTTDQVTEEVLRNREKALAEAIDTFSKSSLNIKLPLILADSPESKAFKAAIKDALLNRNALLQNLEKAISTKTLNADRVIAEIISSSMKLARSDKHNNAALIRFRLGNPPGKSSTTICDQVNWEILLDSVPPNTDLILVTGDTDFRSKRDRAQPSEFLIEEWKNRNGGKLTACDDIGPLLPRIDDAARIQSQITKDDLVSKLVNSNNFAMTHRVIAQLIPFIPLLNDLDREKLAEAFQSNAQINWVAGDPDVASFFMTVFNGHTDKLAHQFRIPLEKAYFFFDPDTDIPSDAQL
jgi:predicted nucleic acid-binding protein